MTNADLYLQRFDHHAELVLNRPAKRNAMTEAMWALMPGLLDEAAQAPQVRWLIVRGTGGHFASGADIGEFESIYSDPARAERYNDSIGRALDALADFPKPSLARIEGVCIGGGCGIALSCDLRFSSQTSRFAITPAKLGLVYPMNDTRRLVEAVGIAMAKDILYSGRVLDAQEAQATGLVQRCLPGEALDAEIKAYTDLLMQRSNHSARMTKRLIALIQNGQDQESEETRRIFHEAFEGDDFKEGYQAFMEKRPPQFPDPK